MIIKSFEIEKIDLSKNKILLLYGKNEGHKKSLINQLIKNRDNIFTYYQDEIIDSHDNFLNSIYSKSLFEAQKTIIIKRATDKLINLIEKINTQKIEDTIILISADILEKKSKLRSIFEKSKSSVVIAFYPDTDQTLSGLALKFLQEKKISISQSNLNILIKRNSGDREALYNELSKIDHFSKSGKKITHEVIEKLTNLRENHGITELVDNCLAKNSRKIIFILNENNFSNEDSILILRTFLIKSKKILKLREEFEKNNNINLTISSAKPPIFWKDKEIAKKQIENWKLQNLKKLIYKINEIELSIKKNLNNSKNLITDFLLEQSTVKSNNLT